MPFPNEHACRVRDPGEFQDGSFRRVRRETDDGKRLDLIVGRLKGETGTTVQAYRYPKGEWSVDEARRHCRGHDGKLFEPASEEDSQPPAGGSFERRSFAADELRVEGGEDDPRIVGHAAVFNQLSEDLGPFREMVAAGAFSKSLGGDVRALFNHDPNIILGRTRARTLRLAEDNQGLAVEITPPNTAMARHVLQAIERGDVSQMSFGFRTIRDRWEQDEDGNVLRTLVEVELFDVSPVTFPAYPQTDVGLRSLMAWQAERAEEVPTPSRMNLVRARQRMAEAGL